jgi:hypothetical protein
LTAFLKNILDKFKNKNTHPYCKYVSEAIYFDNKNNVGLCPYTAFGLIKDNYDGIWIDTNSVEQMRKECTEIIMSDAIHPACKECFLLDNSDKTTSKALKYVYFAQWKFCSLNCTYCDFPKNDNFIETKHYDVLPTIKQMIDCGLITNETTFIFECGDACAHPEFDKLIYFLLNYECKNIIIKTAGIRFCQSIADVIAKNRGEVHISFDAGNRFMYERIKRLDKFNDVLQNTKRYLSYQLPNEKRVAISYNTLSTVNDNEKELLDWFILAKNTGIKKLSFDIDMKWYNSIRYSIPKYLKDIILFIKNMSDYNDIEIVFGEFANSIYKTALKEEPEE